MSFGIGPLLSRGRQGREAVRALRDLQQPRYEPPSAFDLAREWDAVVTGASASGTTGIWHYALAEIEPDQALTYKQKPHGRSVTEALRRFEIEAQDTGEDVTELPVGAIVRVWAEVTAAGAVRHVFDRPEGGGGGETFTPTFMMITDSTPTGVNDANGNPVQWEYTLMPVERGAEVVGTVTGMDWTESSKRLSKSGSAAFADYQHQNGDVAVIADTAGVTAGEYSVGDKVDDDTIQLTTSITGAGDASGVELTRIKRFSGYGAWQAVQGANSKGGFNHYEENNDGVGRQGNGIDHDGAAYPAGFKMQPIQDGLIVRVQLIQVNGGEEAWFAEPNAEDGTCV